MNLITTLGFDISHTLLVITKTKIKPSKIITLVGRIGDEIDQRVESAYTMLKQFTNMININIERIDINVIDIYTAIEKIYKTLEENIPAILDISGGLRLLVLETYIAYTLLNPTKASNISIQIALEGRNEIINIDINDIKRKIITTKFFNNTTIKILNYIKQKEIIEPKQIIEELNKQGYKITKQKLSKILTKLIKAGYIEKIERGKYKYKQ